PDFARIAMAFDEILHRVGDSGRFQMVRIVLFTILSLLSPSHDILENFTAAIPDHHCSVNLPDNSRSEVNITMNLTTEALLKVSIPMGPNQKPEQCRRFRHTQWQFLDSNASVSNNTKLETEPCLDGWTYDHSVFTSTIVTEVRCLHLVMSSELTMEPWNQALRSKLTEDGKSTSKHVRITDIIINPMMRKIVLCYSTVVAIYRNVKELSKDLSIAQPSVDPSNQELTMHMVKQSSNAALLEMHVLRLIVFLLGKGCIAVFICISLAYSQELSPTVLRSTLNSVYITSARIGTVISALVLSTRKHFVHLPMILYGIIPIVATISIYFLPETLNLPLVDSVKDLEKRTEDGMGYGNAKEC
ncbi:hypothetical protein STEG23_010968, partial [Scotinomys teguina]